METFMEILQLFFAIMGILFSCLLVYYEMVNTEINKILKIQITLIHVISFIIMLEVLK